MADIHSTDAAGLHEAPVHHETSDANIRGVLAFGAGLFITGVFIHFLVWLLFGYFAGREAQHAAPEFPLATAQEHRLPPEPRLQTDPRQDLLDLRAQEDKVLDSYGWVDRGSGVVRIPIGEAMKLTIERGLPSRPESTAAR
jgi:hypothetical protein